MKFSCCFSYLKWQTDRTLTRRLHALNRQYADSLCSSVMRNSIDKLSCQGHFSRSSLWPNQMSQYNVVSGFVYGNVLIKRCLSKYVNQNKNSIYFDTHLMVTDIQKCGFSLEQSEVITSAINDVVHSAVGNVKGDSVSRVEQEQLEVRLKSLIEKVRNDMIILEKTEFVRMKDECGKLKSEVASLKLLLQEEVVKLKSSQALDTSLERSRVKEEFQFRDQKIKDNNNRIDTEVARVETKLEAQKLDLLKYLVGSVLSLTTISLAFWRFFRM